MSNSAEKREARKVAAERFHENLPSGRSKMSRMYARPDDDQEVKIPKHGKRGLRRLPFEDKSASLLAKTSSIYSKVLIQKSEDTEFWKDAGKIIGIDVIAEPDAPLVVLDTNVVVSGLPGKEKYDTAIELMDLALNCGSVASLITWEMVGEFQGTLKMLGDNHFLQLRKLLTRSVLISVLPDVAVPEVKADPDDTIFVEALIQAMRYSRENKKKAPYLVTIDNHLLKASRITEFDRKLRGRIITPEDLLKDLRR
jgi:predicted nucleic acid-binding protein